MLPLPSVSRAWLNPEVEVPKVDADPLCGENMLLLPKSPPLKDSLVLVPPRIPSPKPKPPLPMYHTNLHKIFRYILCNKI